MSFDRTSKHPSIDSILLKNQCLGSIKFQCGSESGSWIRTEKTGSKPGTGSGSRSWTLLSDLLIFLRHRFVKSIFLLYFANFYAKTWWTIQISRNFYNLSFLNSSDLGIQSKIFSAVFRRYFSTWIRIRESAYFGGSGSRKPKSCGSNGS